MTATRTRLPMSFEEVTPEWLTEALSPRFPGIRIAGYQRGSIYAGTSSSAQLVLDYAERAGHAGLPEAVYIKGGFNDVMRRRVWQGLIQEAQFYVHFGDKMPVNISGYFFAGIDEEAKQGILLLEDLSARKVRFGSNLVPVSADLMARILEQMALYHGKFWQAPLLADYQHWRTPQRLFLDWMFRPKNWEEIKTRAYAKLVPQILPDRDFAVRALHRLWSINDALPQTLQHGDLHGGNMFFESDGRPGFLDWQTTFPGAVGHDLTHQMVTAMDTETRRANEVPLLRHYLEALRATGVDAPSFDALFLSYRQNIMHDMSSSVGNPFDMQNQEITNTTSFRTLHAAADLDLIGALGLR